MKPLEATQKQEPSYLSLRYVQKAFPASPDQLAEGKRNFTVFRHFVETSNIATRTRIQRRVPGEMLRGTDPEIVIWVADDVLLRLSSKSFSRTKHSFLR